MSMALDHIQDKVAEYGWAATGTVTDDDIPYIYTIGLWQKYQHPEVVITGLPMQQAHTLLVIVAGLLEKGKQFAAGDDSSEIIDGRDKDLFVRFSEVSNDNKKNLLCQAYYHNDKKDFEAIQMLWPDTQGLFPGDEGFEEKFLSQFRMADG